MTVYEIEVTALGESIAALGGYDRMADQELTLAMQESATAIQRSASDNAPRWRGNLAGSMTSRVTSTASVVIGEVYSNASNPIYPLVMEYGRRAGAKPPPVEAIRPWVADKLGDGSLAFVVARSIGRKGIKGRRFLGRAYSENQAIVHNLFRIAVERLAQRLSVGG